MKILLIAIGVVAGSFFLLLLMSWLSFAVPEAPAREHAVVVHGLLT